MGSLVSAISGSSKKAARKQMQAAHEANGAIMQARDINISSLEPIANVGMSGLNELTNRLGIGPNPDNPNFGSLLDPFTGEDLASTPGYQFGMEQGQLALQRQQAASGGLLSGAALKAANRFGQDYAGTKFQEGYNRDALDKDRINNFLGSVANLGVSTTNNIANLRTDAAQKWSNNRIGAGNAAASGIIGQSNAWGSAINQGIGLAVTGAMMGGGMPGFFGGSGGGMSSLGSAAAPGMGGANGFAGLSPNFQSNYLSGLA